MEMNMNIYYSVPFSEKDQAWDIGARWDKEKKLWFAPSQEISEEMQKTWLLWIDKSPIQNLVGEDRGYGGKDLYIDLIPSNCWFTNVRWCIAPDDWKRLSKGVRLRAGFKCEVCGRDEVREKNGWLEAHERFSYNVKTEEQQLQRIVCLCRDCHAFTHYGLAQLKGKTDEVRKHYLKVTGKTEKQLDGHILEAFSFWDSRNDRPWELNLEILTNSGIEIVKPVAKEDRLDIAKKQIKDIDQLNEGDCV